MNIKCFFISTALASCMYLPLGSTANAEMGRIRIADGGKGFVVGEGKTAKAFTPWGFNYDRDDKSRLIEDYWDAEWPTVEQDFAEMKALGANVVRIHLQVSKFLSGPDEINAHAIENLGKLLALAERTGIYVDLTGLGCYRKRDVPAWYDALDEPGRWRAQAVFWSAVAGRCKVSPAVFCFDLMNEPVVPGGKRKPGDWLGPPFGEFCYVQCLTLDQAERPRAEIARRGVETLTRAIRQVDPGRLITVGLVDWSLDRPGMYSGCDPLKIAGPLDFVAVHLYPEAGAKKLDEAMETLRGFAAAGKPVVVEETFPLKSGFEDFRAFLERSRSAGIATGWIGFYWGKTAEECRRSGTLPDAIMAEWLDLFRKLAPAP
jgi:Cellulase (glycosyl hydrolase family 5)